ncbi:ATP-binding cassette domain-containing protein [Leucobacter sp. wl10]|uniref:ATP-binding cassette domain-containing protein n=1 Tax=Leucobacter sp. wl10 TaxID=2304677 RepID=UPI000E5B252B|nr:ATP-binding cassette domain-containing protein [Leucobacter sp. wl10]RGE19173.1 sugar ABC transporter ATP-binding protein [Leucobacter sp. wl10]
MAVLEARGIRKSYGSVNAIRHADFELREGEVHALIGDNGAGKSTLIKILSGTVVPDAGTLMLGDEPVVLGTPQRAREYGIETVYQDLALADTLSAAKNICLGREVMRGGLLGKLLRMYDDRAMRRIAVQNLEELGVRLPSPDAAVGGFSGGQRQAVAIARAAVWGSRLLIMDEPTAALGVVQTNAVLDLIHRTKEQKNLPVILISHNMRDVMRIADRVTVLYLGRTVLTIDVKDATSDLLVDAMTGKLNPLGKDIQ